jgi:D-serine deaminase-like pyridoxal phosphate-dependent protein
MTGATTQTCARPISERRSRDIIGSDDRLRCQYRLVPGHCDPTVNLYDWYVCIRGNRVEQLWPITARGAVY